jgi:hypothetical protein
VETTVANAEFAMYGQMPLENTARYWDSVGEKTMCGVLVLGLCLGLERGEHHP